MRAILLILFFLPLNIAYAQLTTGIKLGLTTGTPIGPREDGATGKLGIGTIAVENQAFDESQHLQTLDYGLIGGIRYQTNFGINYELRMTTGMRSVFKNTYPLAEGVVRNIYLQLTAGYKFGRR